MRIRLKSLHLLDAPGEKRGYSHEVYKRVADHTGETMTRIGKVFAKPGNGITLAGGQQILFRFEPEPRIFLDAGGWFESPKELLDHLQDQQTRKQVDLL